MFSGLIETCGTVEQIQRHGPGIRLSIQAPQFFAKSAVGDSIAINGCCLTIVAHTADRAHFDAGAETLGRTTLADLQSGARVNLERALQVGSRLGGHWVAGHIDGMGVLSQRNDQSEWAQFVFDADLALTRQMARKGSIAVDGVSLTLVDVGQCSFSVALIPHTLTSTTLGERRVGDRVHLETDILAKYVERQLLFAGMGTDPSAGRSAP